MTKQNMEQVLHEIDLTFPEGSKLTMTLADILREEGLKEGLSQGVEKGKVETLSEIANMLLFRKFGEVPKDIKEHISNADPVALQLL
ncbi:hypothetical protein [Sporosarcina sp. FSL W7-1283]|uniref:hypothetical protein n=1 Tax=Sporosarcina sp. FSL W7-1283 TaxID=2921560 RepID=UPI0030FA9860